MMYLLHFYVCMHFIMYVFILFFGVLLFVGESEPVESKVSEIEIVIKKTTAGLGLSIAGGVGSTPYKGNDEVC